jgi:hypothetical protein
MSDWGQVAVCETKDPRLARRKDSAQEREWHYQVYSGKVAGLKQESVAEPMQAILSEA